jgi:hypothetical protein
MRGNRSELKQGYSAADAVGAVVDIKSDTTQDEAKQLQAYAEGFAAGMVELEANTYPAPPPASPSEARETVVVGRDGQSQPIRRYRDELHLPDHQRAAAPAPSIAEVATDPTLTDDYHLKVVTAMIELGMTVHFEFPGMVAIDRGDGTTVDTGQHGWDYGTIREVTTGTENSDGPMEVEIPHPEGQWPTPGEIAAAWYEAIEGVSPVAGITPAQVRAIAESVDTMNTVHSKPVECREIMVKMGSEDPEEDGEPGDAVASFRYREQGASDTPRLGLEITAFKRNGDVRWSQDYA